METESKPEFKSSIHKEGLNRLDTIIEGIPDSLTNLLSGCKKFGSRAILWTLLAMKCITEAGCGGSGKLIKDNKPVIEFQKSAFGPGAQELALADLTLSEADENRRFSEIWEAFAKRIESGLKDEDIPDALRELGFLQLARKLGELPVGGRLGYLFHLANPHALRDEHLSHTRLHELGLCKCTKKY
ncbi:MAG: hypothetical protein AB1352_01990 [Patescibacteria group bacterium]